MKNLSRPFVELLLRCRWWLLGVAVVLSLASIWPATHLQFDRSIESVFPDDDPRLVSYQRLRDIFGGNEIVLAVYRDEDLFAPDGSGLRRVGDVRAMLQEIDGVSSALSIDRPLEIVGANNPLAAPIRDVFAGYTHSPDGKIVALVCMLKPRAETTADRSDVIVGLRSVMENDLPAPLSPGLITGEPVMVNDGYRFVEQDGRRLGWATTILLAGVIVLCFRSLRWVIIPVVLVQVTLLWTQGLLVASHLRLSMVSSMLTAVVTVVGIATVIHVIVRFREARADGHPPREALLGALTILILPITWACCTDAAGFGSLLVTNVGPVQDFGLMMAIGSLLVIVSVLLVLPALALAGPAASDPQRAWGEKALDVGLHRLVHWVEHRPWLVGGGALVITAICSAGMFNLQVESDFTKNFRSGSEIVKSYAFVEENLGGAGVWDVMLPAPDKLDYDYLHRVHRLEARLNAEVIVTGEDGQHRPGLTKTLSLADAVDAIRPGIFGEIVIPEPIKRVMGDRAVELDRQRRNTEIGFALYEMKQRVPTFFAALYANDPQFKDQHWLRIMLRSRERQSSAAKQQIIERVTRIVNEAFPAETNDHGRAPEVTGFFVLLTYLIDSLLADQWLAFAVACAGIGLMMLVAFRNPLYALVALVPNVLPIIIVTGLLGWSGLKVNMGAAMIAAVSMGLSIDSSIHYITSFQRARREGKNVAAALGTVHQSVGRAMVFSTLALIAGFIVLCFSQFIPTVYFGALVSLTMLGGLAGNLLVLPLLLKFVTWEYT